MEVFIYMRIKNISTSGSFKNGGSTAGSSKRANDLFAIKLLTTGAAGADAASASSKTLRRWRL